MLLLDMLSFFSLWLDSFHRQNCAADGIHKWRWTQRKWRKCCFLMLWNLFIAFHNNRSTFTFNFIYGNKTHTLHPEQQRERESWRIKERKKSNRFELRLSHSYDFRPVGRISWKYHTVRAQSCTAAAAVAGDCASTTLAVLVLVLLLLAVDGYNNNKQ